MKKISLLASSSARSKDLAEEITESAKKHGLEDNIVASENADVIVVLGGDGFMLRSLHNTQRLNKKIYGLNCGTVGFLMNNPTEDFLDLINRIEKATLTKLYPLKMVAYTHSGKFIRNAINEVTIFRQSHQAAKIRITINGVERIANFVGDGLIVATPAGSTAYNLSAHGPIIPLGAPLVALTPICPFRPRRWRGALLPDKAKIKIDVLTPEKRAVNATADDQTIFDVKSVEIYKNTYNSYDILFDDSHNLEERIIKEQFDF